MHAQDLYFWPHFILGDVVGHIPDLGESLQLVYAVELVEV